MNTFLEASPDNITKEVKLKEISNPRDAKKTMKALVYGGPGVFTRLRFSSSTRVNGNNQD